MFKYINKLLEELSHNMLWTTKTLVTNKLINISNNTNKFQKTKHNHVITLWQTTKSI